MKRMIVLAALIGLAGSHLLAGGGTITGSYVEARTAEVFAGGCVMNSEINTEGKEAILAWKVDRGSFNGVSLDGLSIVAAMSSDTNLGQMEFGGDIKFPTVRTSVVVDQRANAAQKMALVAMANDLSKGLMGSIVSVSQAPIQFAETADSVKVVAGPATLGINKHMSHDPTCGAQQWFKPMSVVQSPEMGMTEQNSYSATNLGVKWSFPDKRSSFFGTFSR